MALRSVLDKYKSISRPSLRGFSSFSDTLVKRTNSAEDAIADNQYETGQISPETYKLELTKRLSRSYITPLQRVNLQEKIGNVAQAVQDAQVDRKYAAGEYTTNQVLQYEQSKLKTMPATDSAAYLKQQQKVQGLTDKLEKEKRTAFRVSENLRISKMPEDSSDRLYAKAQEYAKLEQMARVDNDIQTADVFATNKNNYLQATNRAEINDQLTNIKKEFSAQEETGLGVPSSEEGSKLYNRLTGQSIPADSGGQPGAADTGGTGISSGAGGFQTPQVKNALESLAAKKKQFDRTSREYENNEKYIGKLSELVNKAQGDQRTQLQIQLNNAVGRREELVSRIDNIQNDFQEGVIRIQEIQQRQAASNFGQEVRLNNQSFTKVENELETALAKGKISKDEYLQRAILLATDKNQFFNQASDGFNQFGNDSSSESYLQKATELERIHENLINVANRLDDYELVNVDPGGTVNNILGRQLRPGEFSLTNIRQLKDRGIWDAGYVRKDNVYYKVHYPAEYSDQNGDLLPQYINEDLAKLRDTAFIYDEKGNQEFVKHVVFTEKGKPIIKSVSQKDADNLLKQGKIIDDSKKGLIQKPKIEKSLIEKGIDLGRETDILGKVLETGSERYRKEKEIESPFIPGQDILKTGEKILNLNQSLSPGNLLNKTLSDTGNYLGNLIYPNLGKQGKQVVDYVSALPKNITSAIKNAGSSVGDFVKNILGGKTFAQPKLEIIPKAKAKEIQPTDLTMLINAKAQKYGIDPQFLKATILTENANLDPNVTRYEAHLGESSYGLGQILLSTARRLGFKGNPEDLKKSDVNLELTAKYLKTITDSQNNKGISSTPETIVREYNSGNPYGETTPGHLERFFENYQNPSDNTFQGISTKKIEKAQPKISVKPTILPIPSSNQSAQLKSTQLKQQSSAVSIPQQNIVRSQQPPSSKFELPQFNLPKIQFSVFQPPKIQLPKFEAPKPIQNVVSKVQQTVQKATQNVGSFLNKFNPFRKK